MNALATVAGILPGSAAYASSDNPTLDELRWYFLGLLAFVLVGLGYIIPAMIMGVINRRRGQSLTVAQKIAVAGAVGLVAYMTPMMAEVFKTPWSLLAMFLLSLYLGLFVLILLCLFMSSSEHTRR